MKQKLFPLRISAGSLNTTTEGIPNGKTDFLCSVFWRVLYFLEVEENITNCMIFFFNLRVRRYKKAGKEGGIFGFTV